MPRIKTTPTVSAALIILRIYLFGMLLLILGKFLYVSLHAKPTSAAAAPGSASSVASPAEAKSSAKP